MAENHIKFTLGLISSNKATDHSSRKSSLAIKLKSNGIAPGGKSRIRTRLYSRAKAKRRF